MTQTKKLLTALLLTTTLPVLAYAMPSDSPEKDCAESGFAQHHRPAFEGKGAMKQLDLTPEQQRKFHHIKGEEMKARHELVRRYLDKLPEADRQAMQKEMHELHEKNLKAARAELTPEQQKTFDELQKKREEQRQEHEEFMKWKAEQGKKPS